MHRQTKSVGGRQNEICTIFQLFPSLLLSGSITMETASKAGSVHSRVCFHQGYVSVKWH